MINQEATGHQENQPINIEGRRQRNIKFLENEMGSLRDIKTELSKIETEHTDQQAAYIASIYKKKLLRGKATVEKRIRLLTDELDLLRPPTPETTQYRKDIKQLVTEIPPQQIETYSQLRFHGTTLLSSRVILDSGEISTSGDRGLVQTGFDAGSSISVTDLEGIEISLYDYTDFKDTYLPMGPTFVLLPKDEQDASLIGSLSMMSTPLKKGDSKSDRFLYILTTPETHDEVTQRCKEQGYPPEITIDYLDFIKMVSKGTLEI
jgi:hypothetical protein